ncbi:uncharacterized protein ISCGN_028302, partial [Ixodes scapularis]
SVFEEQDADSLKDDHKAYAELGQDHVRPELIPEKIHRIPRAKAGSAQQLNIDHDVDAVYQARQAAAVNGYLNQGFEHDVEPRSPRYVTDDRNYMNTRPQSRGDQDKLSDTRSRHFEDGHRRNQSQDTRQSRDSTLALRPASHYELQDRQRVPLEPYDQRRREHHSREAVHKEYPRKDQPRRETAYPNDDTAAQIAYEAKRRSPEYQEYTPGVKEPRNEHGRPLPLSRKSVVNRQDSSPRSNGEPPQDYSPRGQSPPVQYENRRPDYPGARPGNDQDRRRPENVQSHQRAPRTEPREFVYDNRLRSAQDSPPGRNFERSESQPGKYAGRDNSRGASLQGYDSDPGSSRQDEYRRPRSVSPQSLSPGHYLRNGTGNRKPRPVSAYNARDSGRFDYGPGPLGYEVSSPNQRARSPVADDEGSMSLRRDDSIVRQISPRYDSNIGGGLRTGPPPVGGVPAIGPASIRRGDVLNLDSSSSTNTGLVSGPPRLPCRYFRPHSSSHPVVHYPAPTRQSTWHQDFGVPTMIRTQTRFTDY